MKDADQAPFTPGESVRFHAANLLFLVAGIGLTLAALHWVPRLGRAVVGNQPATTAQAPVASPLTPPWGELEITPFAMQEPEPYLPTNAEQSLAGRWFFARYTPDRLKALFESLPSPAPLKALLLDQTRWLVQPDGVVLHPTRALLEQMDRAARQRLYPVLGESRQNFTHYDPIRFRGAGFRLWFEQSGLHGEILDLLEELTYTNEAGAVCLSDVGLLQGRLTPHEFHQVVRTLFSKPAVLMSLRVRPDSDLRALAAYWGRGGREAQTLALLQSMAAMPGGAPLSVSHLLPPFARARLYTFSDHTNHLATEQDCFWSTVNFFRHETDPRLPPGVSPHLIFDRNYQPCRKPLQLGDALLFFEENNPAPIHACVYIAADVVFTKNGTDFRQPWLLMPLAELLPRYSGARPVRLVTLRPKFPQP